jgi:Bacterial protein of unknown function (DUF899)
MSLPDVVSREQWLEARRQLLAQEKEYTRSRDALNADRRRLPMVKVDQEYVFEGPDGKVTLAGLFGDKRQLIVQHVMFGPDWEQPCPGCSASLATLSQAVLDHLATQETAFVLTSRPLRQDRGQGRRARLVLPLVFQLRQRVQLRLPGHPGRLPRPGRLQLPPRARGAQRRAVHRTGKSPRAASPRSAAATRPSPAEPEYGPPTACPRVPRPWPLPGLVPASWGIRRKRLARDEGPSKAGHDPVQRML